MKHVFTAFLMLVASVCVAQVRPLHEHFGYGDTYYFPYGSSGAVGNYIPYSSTGSSGAFSGTDGNGTSFYVSWDITNDVLSYSFSISPTNYNSITYYTFNVFDDLSNTGYLEVEDFNTNYGTISYSGSTNLGQTQRNIEFNFRFDTNDNSTAGWSLTDGYTSIHYMQPVGDPED